jgi:hypothetical protein
MVGRTKPSLVPSQSPKGAQPDQADDSGLWVILTGPEGEVVRQPADDPRHAVIVAIRLLSVMLAFGPGFSVRTEITTDNVSPLKP